MSRLLFIFALTIAFSLTCGSAAPGIAADTNGVTHRVSLTWVVNNPPAGPWDVYLQSAVVPPGSWPGPHTHPGPEYGFVLSGIYTRWNEGASFSVRPSQRFFTPMGVIHEGGNASDGEVVFYGTHILAAGGQFAIPADPALAPGAPKIAPGQITIYRIKFPLVNHPTPPFKLTMEILDFTEAGQTPVHSPPGILLGVVMSGRLSVMQNGTLTTYGPNQGFQVPPSATFSLASADGAPASVALSLLGS